MLKINIIAFSLVLLGNINLLVAQDQFFTEIEYYNSFLEKFLPEDSNKAIVVHIRRAQSKDEISFSFVMSSVYDQISLKYVDPKYILEYDELLILIKTELDKNELPYELRVSKYDSDDESILKLWHPESESYLSYPPFVYCYVFYQIENQLTNFSMAKLEDIPRSLDFYTNEDIYRVEGEWPETIPERIK